LWINYPQDEMRWKKTTRRLNLFFSQGKLETYFNYMSQIGENKYANGAEASPLS
jgi:hypothetical protein